jgi:hypothetical protein
MMFAMRIVTFWATLVVAAGLAGTAAADPTLTPITNRDYALDMWSSIPFGDATAVSMGGANVAKAYGSSGSLDNPAAAAISKATDDVWGFDYHIDYTNGSLSTDYGNAGINYGALGVTQPDTRTQQLTLGGSLRVYDWGAAISGTVRSMRISDAAQPGGGDSQVYAETLLLKGALAHFFAGPDVSFGAAAQLAVFNLQTDCAGPQCGTLFTVAGWGAQAGLTWLPHMQSFRLAAVLSTGITGNDVTGGTCTDPNNCDGFILPETVVVPATATLGWAYRFGPTEWNKHVEGSFRDEMALTVALDAVVTAPVDNAYGLDAFGIKYLERSDEHFGFSPRGGLEWEMLPGRFRIRGGSYWEPSRFDGVDGRLHGTFGAELRVFEVNVWGPRRGRITLTGDLARDYSNLGISIGLWH